MTRSRAVGATLTVARKEARDILRERTVLVALLVQLMVAGLSTILAVGITALLDPSSIPNEARAEVAYVGDGGFLPYLGEADGLDVDAGLSLDAALDGQAQGRFDAVVEEVPPSEGAPRTVRVLVTAGSLQATILVPTLRTLLEDYQRDLRAERQDELATPVLEVPAARRDAVSHGFVHGALVPLLLLTPAFLSGAIGGDSWVRETQTGTLLLLRSTPAPAGALVAGKLLVPLLLAPMQAAAWLAVLTLGGAVVHNWPWLLLATFLLAALLAGLGVAVAAIVRRTAASQTVYALLVLVVAGASLFLPRDLFNVLALLSAGTVLPDMLASLAVVAAAALAALAAGIAAAARATRG